MWRLQANRPNEHHLIFFVDITKDSEASDSELPDRGNRLERRHEVLKELSVSGRPTRCLRKPVLDGVEDSTSVMSPQALEVIAGSSGEFDFVHAYSCAYAVAECNRKLQEPILPSNELQHPDLTRFLDFFPLSTLYQRVTYGATYRSQGGRYGSSTRLISATEVKG